MVQLTMDALTASPARAAFKLGEKKALFTGVMLLLRHSFEGREQKLDMTSSVVETRLKFRVC